MWMRMVGTATQIEVDFRRQNSTPKQQAEEEGYDHVTAPYPTPNVPHLTVTFNVKLSISIYNGLAIESEILTCQDEAFCYTK